MNFCRSIAILFAYCCVSVSPALASPPYDSFEQELAKLEAKYGGRLGVAMLRTRDNTVYTHRGDERFPMCSTFKVVAVAQLLAKAESDPTLLDTRLPVSEDEIMPFSNIIRKYLATGITLGEMAEACLVVSDNTAANKLLAFLGGPESVTAYARSLGDTKFRLDRWEMEMNNSEPGDERDTTTPLAMAETLRTLVLGDALAEESRNTLFRLMRNCMTGYQRWRGAIPKTWMVADKTGTGDYGTTNIIGILWPPSGPPLVLTVFYTGGAYDDYANDAIIQDVVRLATRPGQPLPDALEDGAEPEEAVVAEVDSPQS